MVSTINLGISGDTYVAPGIAAYQRQHQEPVVKNLKKKALALGFYLIPQPPAPECVSEKLTNA